MCLLTLFLHCYTEAIVRKLRWREIRDTAEAENLLSDKLLNIPQVTCITHCVTLSIPRETDITLK